jgi:hypothetical protein
MQIRDTFSWKREKYKRDTLKKEVGIDRDKHMLAYNLWKQRETNI